jgi:hypothetical protein
VSKTQWAGARIVNQKKNRSSAFAPNTHTHTLSTSRTKDTVLDKSKPFDSTQEGSNTMKSFAVFTSATLMSFVVLFALIGQHQAGVEAGKKMMKNALMAALLLHGGKKILFPIPIL